MELNVPLVPYSEWLTRLERLSITASQNRNGEQSQDANSGTQIRAVRLIPFYKAISSVQRGDAMGFPKLSSSNLSNLTDVTLPQLNDVDIKQWLSYWRRASLLSNS